MHLAGEKIEKRGPAAAIRHMHKVDAGHYLEKLTIEMRSTPASARRVIDLARISLGIRNELRNGLGGERRKRHKHPGPSVISGDRRNVVREIEFEVVVQRRIDSICESHREKCIAIWGRANDRFGGDVAASANTILDNELLTKPLRQPLSDQTCEVVSRTARSKTDNQMHRSGRISLRHCDARYGRQRTYGRGQM